MHSTMSNVKDATEQVPSLWESWGENWGPGYQTWQHAIGEAACLIADHVGALQGVAREHLEQAQEDSQAALFGAALGGLELGAVLGYSLARTWPDGIEGLTDWPQRALEHAGLASVEHDEPQLTAAS